MHTDIGLRDYMMKIVGRSGYSRSVGELAEEVLVSGICHDLSPHRIAEETDDAIRPNVWIIRDDPSLGPEEQAVINFITAYHWDLRIEVSEHLAE